MLENPAAYNQSMTLKDQKSRQGDIASILLSAFGLRFFAAVSGATEDDTGGDGGSNHNPFRPLRIVIAGGGTGGHLFPGIAVSQEFKARNAATRIIFVSTGNRLEKSVLSKAGFELQSITAAGIKGFGMWNQIKSVAKIPTGILQANRILKRFSPDLVIGLGSYSAGPVVFAAWLQGIPIVIQEQNILPGITNRILSRFAKRMYVSFENTRTRMDPRKIHWTGNPVRRELFLRSERGRNPDMDDAGGRPFTVLIIGGSQGAHKINTAVMEALEHLSHIPDLYFVHQTGDADEQPVREAYRRNGIHATVQSFFDDMAGLYRKADLIICRAGATTVAEVAALGKAAIFVPFPFAADNHQALNAASLSDEGAAETLLEKNLSGEIISEKIRHYAGHPADLKDMAARAKRFGKPDAAGHIVDDCYRMLENNGTPA